MFEVWSSDHVGQRNVLSYKAIPVYGQPSVMSNQVSRDICAKDGTSIG